MEWVSQGYVSVSSGFLGARAPTLGRDTSFTFLYRAAQTDVRATRPWVATGASSAKHGTGQALPIYLHVADCSLDFKLINFAVTRSGKELYSFGNPINCAVDAADILCTRLAELDEHCSSEDDVDLEGDWEEEDCGDEVHAESLLQVRVRALSLLLPEAHKVLASYPSTQAVAPFIFRHSIGPL